MFEMFSILLLAILFLPAVPEDLKMVIVFGKVTDSPQTVGTSLSKDDCFKECFSARDCILAYFNSDQTCSFYNYTVTQTLTVDKTGREDGCYVAFKASMSSNSCPASLDLINLTVTVLNDTYYWNRTESGWYFKKCIDDWKLFHRKNDVSVCMQSFNMTYGSTLEQARELCITKGHVLSGLATIEECKWAYGKLLKQTGVKYSGYWIDGKRSCPVGVDCSVRKIPSYLIIRGFQNFVSSDGYTNENDIEEEIYGENNFYQSFTKDNRKEDCLIVSKSYANQTLNDVNCDGYFKDALGVVCGYQFN